MSKRRPLTGRWIRWRRYRYWALVAGGMNTDIARRFADREARGRRRLAASIGRKAAEEVSLICFERGGELVFAFSGCSDDLTDEQRASLEARPGFKTAAFV